MRKLLREASNLGVSVHLAHLDDDEELLGYYVPDENIVVVRLGMTRVQTRSVLAHELAHARLGHACSSGREERQADRLAAMLLITPEAYAAAERISHDVHAIADELSVLAEDVENYRRYCLQRLGTRTYARSWRVGLSPAAAAALQH